MQTYFMGLLFWTQMRAFRSTVCEGKYIPITDILEKVSTCTSRVLCGRRMTIFIPLCCLCRGYLGKEPSMRTIVSLFQTEKRRKAIHFFQYPRNAVHNKNGRRNVIANCDIVCGVIYCSVGNSKRRLVSVLNLKECFYEQVCN